MRRGRFYSVGPRRINASRQNVGVGDRRLLPGNKGEIAAFRQLVEFRIQLLDLFLKGDRALVYVVEVEIADRMPLVPAPFVGRLTDHLRGIVLEGQPLRFLQRQCASI